MASIRLKPRSRSRVLHGHSWVYAGEIQKKLGTEVNGKVVTCRDSRGRPLGNGIYNETSQIIWRRISKVFKGGEELNRGFFEETIQGAVRRRDGMGRVCRLVWSESDGLPGLVVDRYEDVLVVQCLTLAMDEHREEICEVLEAVTGVGLVVLRNDAPVRRREGLESVVEIYGGDMPKPFWVQVGLCEFRLDLGGGQKTGFYLDQRFEYEKVSEYVGKVKKRNGGEGVSFLDAFCNQGGFALHGAKAGAEYVEGVDVSTEALGLARENAEHNGVEVTFRESNVFDFLRRDERRWDVVVLDPPSFAKSKDSVNEAIRGYKELHLRVFQKLKDGGILATYSCSFHISHDVFLDMIRSAAGDAGREVRILEVCRQAADHPAMVNIPESEYLRGFILEVR